MKDIINGLTERFRQEHTRARRYVAIMLVLALLTTLFVNWQLHGVGISMTADYHCDYEEHQHTEACYEKVLTCGYEEGEPETPVDTADTVDTVAAYSMEIEPEETEPETILVPHTHTDECYEERQVLTCFEEEHIHDDDCFDETGTFICDKFEHVHDDSCYTTEYDLVCGLDEGELVEEENPAYIAPVSSRPVVIDRPAETDPEEPVLHTHTDACYTDVLVCTIPEHHHTVECLADAQADVETAEEWQAAANVALNGNWAEDLLTVAKSQLDYQQSEKNFKLDVEDQQVLRGYSRYGAWYGNPYGAWDVMFLSYCLHFAGVPQSVVPQRAGVLALHSELRGSAWLTDADGTTAKPGDIVIYNTLTTEQVTAENPYGIALLSLDEAGETEPAATEPQIETRTVSTETVGVVSAVENGTLTVISGNVDGKVAEVTISTADVTSVISVTGAYAAQSEQNIAADADAAEDDDFSISVVRTSAPTAEAAALAAADEDAAAPGVIQLEDGYINNNKVDFTKTVNGKDIPIQNGDEVEDGETVKVHVSFQFPQNVLTKGCYTVTYQLPGGLKLNKTVDNGIVKDESGKAVGTYTINAQGLVTMVFYEEYRTGAALEGVLEFTATADYSQAEDGKVTIGGTTVHIQQPKDLAVTKGLVACESHDGQRRWRDEDGNFCFYWQVNVTTKKGSGGKVTLEDTLTGIEASYAPTDLIRLVKYDAGGQTVEMNNASYVLSADGRTLTYKDLPELKPGERYELYYATTVKADTVKNLYGNASRPNTLYNEAVATVGDVRISSSGKQQITFQRDILVKKGSLNATGRIDWSITVNAPQENPGDMLDNYVLWDAWPNGADLVGNVTVQIYGAQGTTSVTLSAEQLENMKKQDVGINLWELDGNAKTAYKFELNYQTTVPETTAVSGGQVTNVAHLHPEGNTSTDYKSTANVPVTVGSWSLSKKHTGYDNEGRALWNIETSNSVGAATLELWDVIPDAAAADGATSGDVHYALAAELQSAIQANLRIRLTGSSDMLTLTQAETKGVKVTVTCYEDTNGTKPVDNGDSGTPVRSFCITVDASDADARVTRVTFSGVPTHESRDGLTGTWIFRNTAQIRRGQTILASAEDQDRYADESIFTKELALDPDRRDYTDEDTTIGYEELKGADGKHSLWYRITLVATADKDGNIQFSDTLPAHTTFVKNQSYANLYLDRTLVPWSGAATPWWLGYDSTNHKIEVTQKGLVPGSQHKIELIYRVTLDDDSRWNDSLTSKLEYTNKAERSGSEPVSITTTVTRDIPPLIKAGEQLTGSNGDYTNKIRYQVLINPEGKTLGDGDWITLQDTITVPDGVSVYGDLSSVKLYYYTAQDFENGTLQEVDKNLYYTLTPDSGESCWLKLKVPDETAFVLEYVCEIDRGVYANPDIKNVISANDLQAGSESKRFETNDSSASVTRGQLVINKLDSASNKLLPGATFAVEAYDQTTSSFKRCQTQTTGKSGQLVFGVTDSVQDTLHPNVLYRVVETDAPENYIKDTTPRYLLFYRADKNKTEEECKAEAFEAATGAKGDTLTFLDGTVNRNDVMAGGSTSTIVLDVKNTYNQLTVHKYWFDENTNQPLAADDVPVKEIQVQLYRYTEGQSKADAKPWGDVVTLEPDQNGNWTHTWAGEQQLPARDESGSEYYYFVKELTTGNWTLADANNDGVQTGTVVLRNTVYKGYELPSTGGMGTAPFGVLGGAMAAAAALLLARKRKHHANEEE